MRIDRTIAPARMTHSKTGRLALTLGAVGLFMAWTAPARAACGNGMLQLPCGLHAHTATMMETGDLLITGGITNTVGGAGGVDTRKVELVQTTRGGGIILGNPM